jgi:hypothetical protein
MFEALSERLKAALRAFTSRGTLSEKNIAEGLREVRTALLEADVNYKVAKDFIDHVQERALGQDVIRSVTPGQQVVKIVYDELIKLMGPADPAVPKNAERPTVLMLCGLQGHGKTTTAGKLAILLRKIDALRRLKEGTTLVLDFRTQRSYQLTREPGGVGSEIVGPRTRRLYYRAGLVIKSIHLDTLEVRHVCDLPTDVPAYLYALSADERTLASGYYEGGADIAALPRLSHAVHPNRMGGAVKRRDRRPN